MKKNLTLLITLVAMLFLFNASAQTDPTNPQVICVESIESYQVDYLENAGAGTTGSTYTWSVTSPGFLGTITTGQGPAGSTNRIIIDWGLTPVGSYTLEVIETNVGCPGTPIALVIQLTPKVLPVFPILGPFCQNSVAPALPLVSTNGITGTWIPATINTSASGTSTYAFTPDPGQCALPTTIDITIDLQITPQFNTPIGPLCQNTIAPALPLISDNGITGTWNPLTINTAAAGTSTYTFTPDPNQCATTTTLDVTINPLPVVTAQDVSGCAGTAITLIGNPAGGVFSIASPYTGPSTTYTYTYTDANGCSAVSAPANITTNPLPVVTAQDVSGCAGTAITLIGNPAGGVYSLPNPYTGPSTTYTYTYTDANGCSASATGNITTNPLPTPTATDVSGCTGTAIALIGNPVGGVFSVPDPYTGPSTTYTYTYTDANGCSATSALANITVDPQITPLFAPIAALCENAVAAALPLVSTNGITGTWNPSTINTSAAGTSTYTFTPDPNQCATTTTLDVTINPLPVIDVTDEVICEGQSVLLTATGAVTYSWSPSGGLSATTGSSVTASPTVTTTYTVTGTDANGCTNTTTVTVTVNPLPNTSPIFHD
jgi:hypothetical protein